MIDGAVGGDATCILCVNGKSVEKVTTEDEAPIVMIAKQIMGEESLLHMRGISYRMIFHCCAINQ